MTTGKNEVIVIKCSRESMETDNQDDATDDDGRGINIQERLLIDEPRSEASVGRFYLLSLTCGVGG